MWSWEGRRDGHESRRTLDDSELEGHVNGNRIMVQ